MKGTRVALAPGLAFALTAAVMAAPPRIRIAMYNASLNRTRAGQLQTDLATPNNAQARRVAEIIQRTAPDVLLINEFDYDAGGVSLQRFHDNYLAISQNGQPAQQYPHRFAPPVNTGLSPATVHGAQYSWDFDNASGKVTTPGSDAYGNDCFGFGTFPGQYGFAIYSKLPLDAARIRTFQTFLWKDLPDPAWPDLASTPGVAGDWYTDAEKAIFRLSSKTHADVPVQAAPGQWFHLLASHPTPPSFDGTEDRNGRRNRDEIRFWAAYIDGAPEIYDDAAPPKTGGLAAGERFVILGDLNADPFDGDSYQNAIRQLYDHPRVFAEHNPSSLGAAQDAAAEGGINNTHQGNPAHDTADFSGPGNLRVDHVLPSRAGFTVADSGVFWPRPTDPGYALISASDHMLVWVDVHVEPVMEKAVAGLAARVEGSAVLLSWKGEEGVRYSVERSGDLREWMPLEIPVSFDPETHAAAFTDPAGVAGGPVFYRVAAALSGG